MKRNKIMIIVLILLALLFLIKMCPILFQNDTFYDIVLGKRYLTTGMFKIDDYSIHEGLVYQTHHFLACIINYVVYAMFSFKGLYFLEILLAGLIAYLFYLVGKTMTKSKVVLCMLFFVVIFSLKTFISLRAQMYSYIIFLLEILFIEKYLNNNRRRYLVIITLLPLILINFHSGVIYFYFIIMGTYLLNGLNINLGRLVSDKRVVKRQIRELILSSGIGMLLTLINPYGIDGLTYGLKTLNSSYINNHISEFAHYSFSNSLGKIIALYTLLCFIVMLFSNKKIKIHEILLFLGTLFMTFTSIRHFSLLIVTSAVLTSHVDGVYNILRKSPFFLIKMTYPIVLCLLTLILYLGYDLSIRDYNFAPNTIYPVEAVKYIKKNINSNDHIFNEYSWGSYLMFNDIKVFVDSRCDLYNTEYNKTTVFKDYIDLLYNNLDYRLIVSKYDIKYFLINRNDNLVNKLLSNKLNKVVYQDKLSVIIKIAE